MTFEDFRRWALDSSLGAARRWEEPLDDETKVLMAADAYEAFHVIPMPPIYLERERGHVHWLAGALPDIVTNRSLQRVAFRTSAWVSTDPKYADRPVDDPKRRELLSLQVAEKGRYEAWHAPIRRSSSGLPSIGEWEIYATDKDSLSGALPNRIRKALDNRGARRGPTMPAADMVLGSWDVPQDFFPWAAHCGPLDYASESTMSTYMALFRPESPGPTIVSQAITFAESNAPSGHIEGAVQVLRETGNGESSMATGFIATRLFGDTRAFSVRLLLLHRLADSPSQTFIATRQPRLRVLRVSWRNEFDIAGLQLHAAVKCADGRRSPICLSGHSSGNG